MSTAINLMSVLTGTRPEGKAAMTTATEGFAALFGQGGANTESSQQGGDAAAGAKALRGLYNILAGLDKKTAQLDPEGGDPEETLEAVAGLASDLAAALAGFESETGSGPVLEVQGEASGDSALVLDAATGEATLADAMAAVQALKSVISSVTSTLREISAAQMADRTAPKAGEVGLAFVGDVLAASVVPVRADVSDIENSAESSAVITLAAGVSTTSEVTNPPAAAALAANMKARGSGQAAAAAMSGGASVDADAVPLPFIFSSVPSESATDGGARALMARVAAVAADLSGTGFAPDAALGVGAGMETTAIARRLGPVEPLITPEDVARALAQGGQANRDALTAAASARGAESAGEPSRFAGAVVSQISSAEIGEGSTRIELSPRGLGTIEVEVTTGSDGALKVVVRAENPAVLNALREERDLLAQVLGGLDTGSLDLQSFSDGNEQQSQGERSARPAMSAGGESTATGAEPAPVHKAEIGGGRLDIVT